MTKLMLALGFKQCKSNASIYYFIDEETRELVITIIYCYELKSLELDNRTTLVLSNTRKLDRDTFTK